MEEELSDKWKKPEVVSYKKKPFPGHLRHKRQNVNIAHISALSFNWNMHDPENEVFTVSIYEIERI